MLFFLFTLWRTTVKQVSCLKSFLVFKLSWRCVLAGTASPPGIRTAAGPEEAPARSSDLEPGIRRCVGAASLGQTSCHGYRLWQQTCTCRNIPSYIYLLGDFLVLTGLTSNVQFSSWARPRCICGRGCCVWAPPPTRRREIKHLLIELGFQMQVRSQQNTDLKERPGPSAYAVWGSWLDYWSRSAKKSIWDPVTADSLLWNDHTEDLVKGHAASDCQSEGDFLHTDNNRFRGSN